MNITMDMDMNMDMNVDMYMDMYRQQGYGHEETAGIWTLN
jgi:hypothetical protein